MKERKTEGEAHTIIESGESRKRKGDQRLVEERIEGYERWIKEKRGTAGKKLPGS